MKLDLSRMCTACRVDKPINDFHPRAAGRFGRRRQCRECRKVCARRWYRKNLEKSRRRGREAARAFLNSHPSTRSFYSVKGGAQRRGVKFLLSREDFKQWWLEQDAQCHYCGLNAAGNKAYQGRRLSVDRKNNSEGYSLDNIVLACDRCNISKGSVFSYSEWKEIAQKYLQPKYGDKNETKNN